MGAQRKLAAIMFTDMVGYTALMQKDEQLAKSQRDRHRSVLTKYISLHNGEILQYYGDGTLTIFNSAIEAVNAAIEIQLDLKNEPPVPLRIGIHLGDIVYDDEGVYGDGVNISSRIESLSASGGILISEKISDEIKNHPEIKSQSLGRFQLKNVLKPVEIFAITNEGIIVPSAEETHQKSGCADRSIAVLPFLNMSSDADNEYFSDGISEDLINALTRVEGLKVTSRTSSFAYKNTNQDITQIGKDLRVTHILEGSVRKAGNKVRIAAQLIGTEDGFHIWSETYDRSLEDIFQVQDEISNIIANKLKDKLGVKTINYNLVKNYTTDMAAYNLYLKGLYNFHKLTPENNKKAIEYFEKAIEKSPDFTLPYSSLSLVYTFCGAFGMMDPEIAMSKGKEYAEKAIAMDELEESHLSMAIVKLFSEWNIPEAYRHFQKAMLLNPGKALTHYLYSFYYLAICEPAKAVESAKKAQELDPLSAIVNYGLGMAHFYAENYDEAIRSFDLTLQLDPNFRSALELKATSYFLKGDPEIAIPFFLQFQEMTGSELKGLCHLGYAYANSGQTEKAEDCLKKLQLRDELEQNVSLYFDYALIYTGLNNFDKAFENLNKACDMKIGQLIMVKSYPLFKRLRSDARFDALLARMSVAEEAVAKA